MQETLRRRIGRHPGRAGAVEGDVPVDDPAGSNGGGRVAEPVGEENGLAVAEQPASATRRGGRGPRRAAAGDDSFGVLPDLILVDGGRGQLAAAHEVLSELRRRYTVPALSGFLAGLHLDGVPEAWG